MVASFERSTVEYLTFGRFYFEVDGKTRLLTSKVSGVSITIARRQMDQRLACSLVFLHQDGTEGSRWNIVDAIPAKYKTTKLGADTNNLFMETIEIAHAGLVRANI